MFAAAKAAVPRLTPAQSKDMIDRGNALILDVRDGTGLQQTSKLKGALHVARLAGRPRRPGFAQLQSTFKRDQAVILHCAGGGRAALAGKTLKDMGFAQVFNGGGFKELAEYGHGAGNDGM
jgi:rhodanese-related sulfurtransferase